SSIVPLLRYSMRASATCVDDTVPAPLIERGSMTPEKRMYSLPRLMAICFSPATCRLPLGSTPTTVGGIVPVDVLLALLLPWPRAWLAPDTSVLWRPSQLGASAGNRSSPSETLPWRSVLVATPLAALVRSLSTMV